MIIAHGGSAVGYALFAQDGNIVFALRHGTNEIHRVICPIIGDGPVQIEAALDVTGQISLALNDAEPETAKTPNVLVKQPQEDLCIGHDNRNPLDPQAPNSRFNGKISNVRMAVGK